MGREIAYHHHEKFSGDGYNRLSGKEIPLSARIFTIADIYDALRTKRPYKEPIKHEDSVKIITIGDGRTMPAHFDPEVLNAFKKLSADFLQICRIYQERAR